MEVGQTFPRGRQPQFGPYNTFQMVGYTGAPPIYQQPARYPMSQHAKIEQTALSREMVVGFAQAHDKMGLPDPGVNDFAIARPTDDNPAVKAQNLMLTPKPSSNVYNQQLTSMNMFG